MKIIQCPTAARKLNRIPVFPLTGGARSNGAREGTGRSE